MPAFAAIGTGTGGTLMNEADYAAAFQLITHAGNARSAALMAIEAAREFDFEDAKKNMQEASDAMYEAHHIQTELVQQEARGEHVPLNVILVHAQDHLTMAIESIRNAEEFIHIYKVLNKVTTALGIENLPEAE